MNVAKIILNLCRDYTRAEITEITIDKIPTKILQMINLYKTNPHLKKVVKQAEYQTLGSMMFLHTNMDKYFEKVNNAIRESYYG